LFFEIVFLSTVIPLVDVDRELLPIQFEVDPGEACVWNRDEFNEAVVQRVAFTHEDRLALLNQFLDLVDIPCPAVVKNTSSKTPKVKNDTKANGTLSRPSHDTEGWSSDGEFNGARGLSGSKIPGKQLHYSVAKQFGSLGRSVGRKIKKNLIDNFTVKHPQPSPVRLNNVQWECPDFILCARLHTEKHHPCLEQMINNYLQSARHRFEQQQAERQRQTLVWQRRKQHTLAEMAIQEGPSPCINPNCTMYGTALTSYMCTACYAKQLEQEEERAKNLKVAATKSNSGGNQNALYGIGKSVFYAQSDSQSYADATNIPARRPPNGQNGTLYLSNSTFYGDGNPSNHAAPSPKNEEKIVFEKISPNICEKFKPPTVVEIVGQQAITPTMPIIAKVYERNGTHKPVEELSDWRPDPPEEEQRQSLPVRPPRLSQQSHKGVTGNSPVDADLPRSSVVTEKVVPQPTSRLLSHYDSIRKPCKSTGCSSYGMANTQWFCSDCFFIRKKAALARESILEDLKAAQMQ
jgi:OTU domain-containing protein 7